MMKILHFGIPVLVLFVTWLVLSGRYDTFHISVGLIASILVTVSIRRLFPYQEKAPRSGLYTETLFRVRWRYGIRYPFSLLLNILNANLKVAALILDPRMPIDPLLLRFDTTYQTDVAKILLGNSITLTPGTITLDIDKQSFYIHALSPALADSLLSGADQNRVAQVFGEELQDKPTVEIKRGELWETP